jgi:hypothetical protein
MSILDHHAKNLCPAVWEPDGTRLTGQFSALLQDLTRDVNTAQDITRLLLVGDSTSHYWTDNSPIDIILLLPQGQARAKLRAAEIGKHRVVFHLLPDTNLPRELAERFGPLYSVSTYEWFGVVAHDTGELLRPSGLVRRLSWLLFKVLNSNEIDQYDWRIELAAFQDMKANARNDTLEELNRRIMLANHALEAYLPTLSRKEWAAAAELEANFSEDAIAKSGVNFKHLSLE